MEGSRDRSPSPLLPIVPPILSSSTAPHSPMPSSSSPSSSSFSPSSTPPASSLARSLPLPHLDRGTSSSPSLSFPVLLFRGHVRLRPPRAPTRPPLFFSPALLFCSPPLYPLPNPPLLNLPLSQYPCFPFSLSRSSVRTPFLSSLPPLYSALPLSQPPLPLSSTFSYFPKSAQFPSFLPFFPWPPATSFQALHSSSSSHSIPTSAGS